MGESGLDDKINLTVFQQKWDGEALKYSAEVTEEGFKRRIVGKPVETHFTRAVTVNKKTPILAGKFFVSGLRKLGILELPTLFLREPYRDGSSWCCVGVDFEDLQASPAGFGDTPEKAKAAFYFEVLGVKP